MIQGAWHCVGRQYNPRVFRCSSPSAGSAPKYTGLDVINPLAAICAGGMMLETLGESEAAQAIDKAVTAHLLR